MPEHWYTFLIRLDHYTYYTDTFLKREKGYYQIFCKRVRIDSKLIYDYIERLPEKTFLVLRYFFLSLQDPGAQCRHELFLRPLIFSLWIALS